MSRKSDEIPVGFFVVWVLAALAGVAFWSLVAYVLFKFAMTL